MKNSDQEKKTPPSGRFYLRTFGCQMNRHDSERVAGFLQDLGWCRVDEEKDSDLILLNTCSVRRRPEDKVWGRLARYRRMKADRPGLIVGVLGCMAVIQGDAIRERYPEVDLVLGPGDLEGLSERLSDPVSMIPESVFPAPAQRESSLSAWLTVIQGCDNFCSYCVVPYARGREVSRPSAEIRDEVARLGEMGYREVTLLGQNVNSYRGQAPDGELVDFPGLLRLLDPVSGIERIRFLTSHPRDISPALIEEIARLGKVCEFLHFPAQSGSDQVLGRMRRGYTRSAYLDQVRRLKEAVPGIALASDFIIGFPGETDEDFAQTLDLVTEVGFDQIFAFAYSSRPGTAAARMPDDVFPQVKADRLQELLSRQQAIAEAKNQRLLGEELEVLVEGKNRRYPQRGEGRTRTGKMVFFPWESGLTGKLVPVRIERSTGLSLYGRVKG